MLKWIIELLKRIFMNPETTDRTTEDTNVNEKKVVSRVQEEVPFFSSGSGYYSYFATLQVPYQKAGTNDYCYDGFYQFHFSADVMYVRPCNYMEVDTSTGKLKTASITDVYQNIYLGLDVINSDISVYTSQQPFALPTQGFIVYYSTSISNNTIWSS